MDLTIPNTIERRHGAAKKIISCFLQGLLQRKVSLVLMSSNASTIKKTIKWTAILVLIGKTISIESDMVENNRNSMKVEYSNVAILFFFFF